MSAAISVPFEQTKPLKNDHADPLAGFQIQKATVENLKEITDFLLTDFLANEPLNASLKLSREESEHFFTDLVKSSLQNGLSYVVMDPAAKNRLVSVRLTKILRKNGKQCCHEGQQDQQNGHSNGEAKMIFASGAFTRERPENEKVQKICAILHAVESKIWELIPPGITCLASWLILSVSPDYKRRGIAAAILEYKLDELVACGCEGIITEASALNSQNLFKKLGYRRIYELAHAEWRDPVSGEQIFKCDDGTDRVTLEFKPLIISQFECDPAQQKCQQKVMVNGESR